MTTSRASSRAAISPCDRAHLNAVADGQRAAAAYCTFCRRSNPALSVKDFSRPFSKRDYANVGPCPELPALAAPPAAFTCRSNAASVWHNGSRFDEEPQRAGWALPDLHDQSNL